MAPGRKPATRPSSIREEDPPMTDYEREKMENCMRNSRVFRSLGIREASEILKKSRPKATIATREDSGSLYEPEDNDDIEQGVFDKETEVSKRSSKDISITAGGSRPSKRVMAVALQVQDQPARLTRQKTKELVSTHEDTTPNPQDGSTGNGLMVTNDSTQAIDNTQDNNHNEMSTAGPCISKRNNSRHVGRDLDNISRGLDIKMPVEIAEGNLRPEKPLQAAKLAAEAGILLRNHVPIYTHWKYYKKECNQGVVDDFNKKVGSQFTMNMKADPVKEALSDLLKKGQRHMRCKLKKMYFDGIPANQVRTTSPLASISDKEWADLVEMWSDPKHKEKCLKNKASRKLVRYHHMTGSRSYVAQCYVMKQTKFKDTTPTAIDIFKDTHCSSKSGFDDNAKDAIAQMEAYVAEPTTEGKDPKTPLQAVAHVLSKSTFLRNVGLQSTEMKRKAKAAAMNDLVHELESDLQAEKMGSAGLRSKVAELEKQAQDHKEAARKNEEETEKLKQQASEIQGFLRSLFGNKFASPDAQQ